MALNTNEMWSNGIKIAFFPQKATKIRPGAGGFAPWPHSLRRLGALPPDPRVWYVWVTLGYSTRLSG